MVPVNVPSHDQFALRRQLSNFNISLELKEEIYQINHKHWGRVIIPMFNLFGLMLLTIASTLAIIALGPVSNQLTALLIVFLGIWYLTLATYGLSEWYSYTNSVIIITNQRLIDCQQVNLWSRRIQTIDIYEVQSCSGVLAAGWGVLFNFGELQISVLGDVPMRISFVADPERISNQVMRYHNLVAHEGLPISHRADIAAK